MNPSATQSDNENATLKPDPTRLRFLTPETCRVHLGTHGALHVTVRDERIYGGVYAAYAFPVAHPNGYIALIHSGGDSDEVEIGLIRDLRDFPDEQAELIRGALQRRYFVHTITRIFDIHMEHGLVYMDAETDKGRVRFQMTWSTNRAIDYGRNGKVLIDLEENRYLIPNIKELSNQEQARFRRYIYW